MAPTRVREPFHRDDWVYEEKVGMIERMIHARLAVLIPVIVIPSGLEQSSRAMVERT